MAYEGLDVFVTKASVAAVEKCIASGSGPEDISRVTDNVISYCRSGLISPNQLQVVIDALDVEVEVPEFEPEHTVEGLTLQEVADGMAELSAVASDTAEEVSVQGDALAELSEVVSGLVPTE